MYTEIPNVKMCNFHIWSGSVLHLVDRLRSETTGRPSVRARPPGTFFELPSYSLPFRPQENSAAGQAPEGQGGGSAGLLQPGKHLHVAAGLWEGHRLPPQTSGHRSGSQRQVQAAAGKSFFFSFTPVFVELFESFATPLWDYKTIFEGNMGEAGSESWLPLQLDGKVSLKRVGFLKNVCRL